MRANRRLEDLARFPSENPDPVLRVARSGEVLYANAAAAALLEALGGGAGQPVPEAYRQVVNQAFESGRRGAFEMEHAGRIYSFWTTLPPVGAEYVNVYGRDITDRKQAEEALRQANVRLRESQEATANEAMQRRILVEQSRDGIVVLDQNGKVYEANRIYAEMLGYSPEEVRQLHVWDWDYQWTQEQFLDMLRRVDDTGDHFETQHRRKDGTVIDVEISTNGAVIAGQKLVFCVCRDVTDRKRAEEALQQANTRLEELATTDDLTGLANRRRFMEVLKLEVERSRRHGSNLALVMIDIDGFKAINDTYGHAFGDRVLVEVAKALQGDARVTDLAARYGGDEFMVLMPSTGAEEATSAAERIRKRIAERPVSDGKITLPISVSAGISASEADRTATPDTLAHLADEAMYAAKHAGGNATRTWKQITRDQAEEVSEEAGRVEDPRRHLARGRR